jgi:diguanylate cyclase (GGDEF)-like protein
MRACLGSLLALVSHARARSLLLACGFAVGLVLASGAAWFIAQQRVNDIADAERELKNLSFILSEELDRRLEGLDLLQFGLIEHMQQLGINSPESFRREMASFAVHQDLAHRIANLPQIAALSLHDADGNLINFSRSWPAPGIDVRDRDFIKVLLGPDPPKTVISQPQKSMTTGQSTVFFSRRFEAPDGQLIGIVLSTIFTDYFEQLFSRISLSDASSFALFRNDGMLLVRYPQAATSIGTTFKRIENFNRSRASLDHGVTRITSTIDGKDRMIASHFVAHYPMIIAVTNTMDEILGPWRGEVRAFGAVTIFLELLIAAAVGLAIRHLRSHALLEAADTARRQALAAQVVAESGLRLARERADATELLRTQSLRFDTALSNMLQGLLMFDHAGKLLVVNRRFKEMFGLPDDCLDEGMTYGEVTDCVATVGNVSAADMQGVRERRAEMLDRNARAAATWSLSDGRVFTVTHQPMTEGWLATYEEITERIEIQARIAHLAHHDALTDLPNRVLFHNNLEQALAHARRGRGLALHCLDLDQFKAVNDTLGHPVGDELLQAVAARLRQETRDTDTVARLGGDEFAIIQAPIDRPTEATAFASRLNDLLDAPFEIAGHQIVIGTSIGIAFAPQDGTDPDQLLKCADLALYRAKQDGRGIYRLFHAEMDAQMQARRLLELDLRLALRTEQFEMYYQPLIDLHAGVVNGCEALLRWRHPERGLIAPDQFIPLAEEIGLIVPLGEWVLRQACDAMASWPGAMRVAVNLSPAQFKSRNLVAAVAEALRESGLPPDRLELEITETVMLNDTDATLETLHQLQALGVCIAMDDFGTGYSSLSYLRRFPFDRIKIDQSFVRDMCSKQDCGAIIRAVAGLSNELGMATTAEGVETREQLDALAKAGCSEVQGYLFSRPVPADSIPDVLRTIADMLRPGPVREEAEEVGHV